jgi:hypothetical protein
LAQSQHRLKIQGKKIIKTTMRYAWSFR